MASESEVTIAKRVYTFVATRCKKSPKKALQHGKVYEAVDAA
jgi:hypothetical protein